MDRVRSTVAALDSPFSRGDVARAARVSPQVASVYLRRLVGSGEVSRIGRGIFRRGNGRAAPPLRPGVLRPIAAELVDALDEVGAAAQLSGLDVLSPWINQIAGDDADLLVIAGAGMAEVVEDALASVADVVIDPGRREMLVLAGRRSQASVVVRQRSLSRSGEGALRRAEDAWIDLVLESRRGWPVGPSELAAILLAMAADQPSWTRLAHGARRHRMPMTLDPHGRIPLVIEPRDTFWAELADGLGAGS